jgi:hypothetical protein
MAQDEDEPRILFFLIAILSAAKNQSASTATGRPVLTKDDTPESRRSVTARRGILILRHAQDGEAKACARRTHLEANTARPLAPRLNLAYRTIGAVSRASPTMT